MNVTVPVSELYPLTSPSCISYTLVSRVYPVSGSFGPVGVLLSLLQELKNRPVYRIVLNNVFIRLSNVIFTMIEQ